jgi:hypothetical protein
MTLGPPYSRVREGKGYLLTSTTNMTIATGSKVFTVNLLSTASAFVVGSRVRIAYVSNYMEGVVTAYSSYTFTVLVDTTGGSGTYSVWNISIAGVPGAAGAAYPGTEVNNEIVTFTGTAGTLPHTPLTGTLRLIKNGRELLPGAGQNYTLSGANITLATAAISGDVFWSHYRY